MRKLYWLALKNLNIKQVQIIRSITTIKTDDDLTNFDIPTYHLRLPFWNEYLDPDFMIYRDEKIHYKDFLPILFEEFGYEVVKRYSQHQATISKTSKQIHETIEMIVPKIGNESWELIGSKDNELIFSTILNQNRKEALNAAKLAWLGECSQLGFNSENFIIIEWEAKRR